MTEQPRNWPSREQWAKRRRTPWGIPTTSSEAREYLTEPELRALIEAMRQRWRDLGRQMKQAASGERETIRERRQAINRGINALEAGRLPVLAQEHIGAKDLMAPYLERYQQAVRKDWATVCRKAEARPVDDEAWQQELERRAKIEAWEVML